MSTELSCQMQMSTVYCAPESSDVKPYRRWMLGGGTLDHYTPG